MKIIISTNTTWNIYNFRLSLIQDLLENGHEILAVAPRDGYVDKLEELGVKCYHVNLNPKGTNPITDLNLVYQYSKLFRLIKPDLILSYTIKPNIYGNIAASLLRIPTINNISGLGTIFIKNSIATYIGKFLYKLSLFSSYHVFFQNNDDKSLFTKNKLVTKKRSSVIQGSGVDINRFNFTRTKNNADKFLFLGRLISDKGIFEYLDAAVTVLEKYPNKEFLLVGEIGSNNKTALTLKELNHYMNNYPQIKYLGKIDNVIDLLQSVDVMILPSYREGLSKSLIEAASMNLPIITTNVPGCKDVVEDGFNGLLCEVRSKFSLEKAILKMIDLKEEDRLQFGLNGRKKVINRFSTDIVNKIYLDKINEIINT
ncbi:glycosyltransferase family 4 protein [Bacteroidia bacterium]|nr:glycosyltransferase family 4 protein [Bacteroidia bacterium]